MMYVIKHGFVMLKSGVCSQTYQKLKRGPTVYLSLAGKARDAVTDIDVEAIGKDDGVDIIIKKLDEVFLKDKNTLAYMAFKTFYNFRRTAGMSMQEFIVDFERYYNEMKKYDTKLPDGVLAFMVLNAANISDESEKLARATVGELSYNSMKNKILQIFSCATSGAEATPDVKVEPTDTFYGTHNSKNNSFKARNSTVKPKVNNEQQERYSRGGNQSYYRGYRRNMSFRANSNGNWIPRSSCNAEIRVNPTDRFLFVYPD